MQRTSLDGTATATMKRPCREPPFTRRHDDLIRGVVRGHGEGDEAGVVARRVGRASVGHLLDRHAPLDGDAELPLVGGDAGEAVRGDLPDAGPLVSTTENAR